jgi:serine/threonine-protein kinase PpkA
MEIPGYKIEREIGKGGMATVYLATQESLERPVVLKILDKVNSAAVADMTQRFIDEGRIVASMHHPNIVTIFDIGVASDELYISMEYVHGGDLKKRMESHVAPNVALDIVAKIGSALGSAHAHNVIHRDVKPANILFRDIDTPLLTDFGIAKQTDTDTDLTSTGIFLGSPNYVSPEQADGKKVDGRSDIYSLGCIFYEMLTGYKPYHSDSVIDIVIQHKTSPVPTLPEKFELYQPLLDRMMAKSLDNRFADAETMLMSVKKLQALDNTDQLTPDFDITGHTPKASGDNKESKNKPKLTLNVLLLLSAIFFFSLQYVEIKLKSPSVRIDQISTNSVLTPAATGTGNLAEQTLETIQSSPATEDAQVSQAKVAPPPVSEEVLSALAWLGKKSLDEYNLTYPEKDNAYYYFSRLLELQPDNRVAYEGILSIAERYAILAERSLASNDINKTQTYIDIGLQINPDNQALLSLQSILSSQETGVWQTLKSMF